MRCSRSRYVVSKGELQPGDINEKAISDSLYTAGMPGPRFARFARRAKCASATTLLWQISYAELWVTPKFWPEFDEALLHEACRSFANRERRFGGLNTTVKINHKGNKDHTKLAKNAEIRNRGFSEF